MAELGDTNEGAGKRGCVLLDLGTYIIGGGTVVIVVMVGNVVYELTHWEGVGWIPPHDGLQAYGEEIEVREGLHMVIPPDGGRDGGGDVSRNQNTVAHFIVTIHIIYLRLAA